MGAHSSLKLRVFPGKAPRQQRRVSPGGCADCWSGGICLPERSGVLGAVGRQGWTRRAQFCWWVAWAPGVLRAAEGPGGERAPGPRRCRLPGLGQGLFGRTGSGPAWAGAFNCLGPGGGRQAASVAAWPQAGLARGQRGHWEPPASRSPRTGAAWAWACAWAPLPSLPQMAHSWEHQGVREAQWGWFYSLNSISCPQEPRLGSRALEVGCGGLEGVVKSLLPLLMGSEARV